MAEKTGTDTKNCKYCKMEIPRSAKVCPHCRKKQKKGIGKWIVLGIVAILIIAAVSGGGKDQNGSKKVGTVDSEGNVQQSTGSAEGSSSGPSAEGSDAAAAENGSETESGGTEDGAAAEKTAPQEVYHVGDILQDGNLQIVYMASGVYDEQNEFLQPREGYHYDYLQLAFENISDKSDVSVSTFGFEGYADGYNVDQYFGGEDDLSGTLSPGRITSGYIYYEVPDDAQSFEVEYETNFLTQDKLTFAFDGNQNSNYAVPKNTERTEGAVAVGGTADDGDVRITYLSCAPYQSDNQFIQPAAGCQFITCELEFENLKSTDESVSSMLFDCFADGNNCKQSFVREDDLSANLSPGRKSKGTVTFEIPDDAQVVELEYLTNVWTSKRIVFTIR